MIFLHCHEGFSKISLISLSLTFRRAFRRVPGPADAEEQGSGYVKIAIENGPVEIVDFPMSMVDLSSSLC